MDINEFSKAVGVSPTTVSHALSGKRPVNTDTKNLILRKMNELGYTPNANGQRLVKGQAYLVALGYVTPDALDDPFIVQMLRAIYSALRKRDYGLMLEMVADSGRDYDVLLDRVMSRSVDGTIIIGGSRLSVSKLATIAQPWAPCVVIDNVPVADCQNLSYVLSDSTRSISEMVDEAIMLGHRRVAFIGREPDEPVHLAFRYALKQHGIVLDEKSTAFTGPLVSDGSAAFERMAHSAASPTFVFARTDALAYGVIEAAKKLRMGIPNDLSVVAHDELPGIVDVYPTLSTIRNNCDDLGSSAVNMLFAIRDKLGSGNAPIKIESELIVRDSLGRAPK